MDLDERTKAIEKKIKSDFFSGIYEHRIKQIFGAHPDFAADMARCQDLAGDVTNVEVYFGRIAYVREFYDPRHPAIYLIPRNKYLSLRYNDGDFVGIEELRFPFSSYNFYVNEEYGGVFNELYHCRALFRLGGVNQLAYLVSPNTDKRFKNKVMHFIVPQFPHSRYIHSWYVGIMTDVILARAGWSEEERAKIVLGFTCHDIGMPAGGDSIKRVDKINLDEEANFIWTLEREGLDARWKKMFGFDVAEAAGWIRGEGWLGKLLSAIDRISYVALDCFHLGFQRRGMIRKHCLKFPLVMDVWQDIRTTEDRSGFYFTDAERLYNFLLLRAYEHTEFLFNPYSRSLDFFLTKKVKVLYDKGLVTKEELLTKNDQWLFLLLEEYFPYQFKGYISPDSLKWKKFKTEREMLKFIEDEKPPMDHMEYLKGFKTGLNWPVMHNGRIVELKEVLDPKKVQKLERLSRSTAGHYAYYANLDAKEIGE